MSLDVQGLRNGGARAGTAARRCPDVHGVLFRGEWSFIPGRVGFVKPYREQAVQTSVCLRLLPPAAPNK
jgi:hypothetical protein